MDKINEIIKIYDKMYIKQIKKILKVLDEQYDMDDSCKIIFAQQGNYLLVL